MVQNQASKNISFKGELLRKLTHLGAFTIPVGYYVLGLSRSEGLIIMIPITLLMIMIDISRLRGWELWDRIGWLIRPMLRRTETGGDFTGATYILVTACLVIAIFSKPIAVASLAFIIAGDPPSALIGSRWGKRRFKNKSFEGSLSFLAAALIVALITPGLPLTVTLIGAVVATVTEAVSFEIDDNITVPLVSGLAMFLLLKLFF
nr:hypothetical protein [candidate division Zixibacteria bacterium]